MKVALLLLSLFFIAMAANAESLCPGSSRVGQFMYLNAYRYLKTVEVKSPIFNKKIDEALIYRQWWEIPRSGKTSGLTKDSLESVSDIYRGYFSNLTDEIEMLDRKNSQKMSIDEVAKFIKNKKVQTKRIIFNTQLTGEIESKDSIDLQLVIDQIHKDSLRICSPLMEQEGNKYKAIKLCWIYVRKDNFFYGGMESSSHMKDTPIFYEKIGSSWKETDSFEGVNFKMSMQENEKRIEREYCHLDKDRNNELLVNNGERTLASQKDKNFQIISLSNNAPVAKK